MEFCVKLKRKLTTGFSQMNLQEIESLAHNVTIERIA